MPAGEGRDELGGATADAVAALELALLAIVAHALLSEEPRSVVEGGADAAVGVAASAAIASAVARHRGAVMAAAADDLERAATRVAADAIPEGAVRDWALTEAGRVASEAMADVRAPLSRMLDEMGESARRGVYEAARYARRVANVHGHEAAMEMAVAALARRGIAGSEYVRSDGTRVRVPADVTVRRELARAGKDRLDRMLDDVARRLGIGYVDVSFCADARESHEAWHGRRYQLEGSGRFPNFRAACRVGDKADGYGGWNCHHTRALVRDPDAPFSFRDPLAGTGYTCAQVRVLVARQRRLENAIRKERRVREVLRREGLPTAGSTRRIRAHQARLRELVGAHPAVLRREPWRERIFGGAVRMRAARDVLPGMGGGGRRAQLGIEIDELTPCLRRASDGELVRTYVEEVDPRELSLEHWMFDWRKQAMGDTRVYALYVEGDRRVQGLVAMTDSPESDAMFLNLAESAPHNNRYNHKVEGQEYVGVGGHLFAEAVKRSLERGYNGFVFFNAKTDLIRYYADKFGAVQIGSSQRMWIGGEAAWRLYERYYGKG